MPAKRSRKNSDSGGTYARGRGSAAQSGKSVTQIAAAAEVHDLNLEASGLLYEMAALQPTERSRFGYKRAAKAIRYLAVSVADLVEAGTLREIPFVGPASERIITELVRQGSSPTVEAALDKASKGAVIREQRALRAGYLSHLQLSQALADDFGAGVVSKAEYRGDFQMHSTWSDGGETIGTMAEAAMALGHSCLGITDHSYGLPVARGISMEQAARQWAEIDRLNSEYEGRFRVYKGIEANILADGALDLQPEECAQFEFVVASPHSALRKADDQTQRMLTAVRTPGVAILGHPRGRMFGSRPGVSADWDAVFEEAAKLEVAIEIDGNWHRQDVDYRLAGRALAAGCILALDSDAHSIAELRFSDYAIAHARLARAPAERVINCWGDERLGEWMRRRHGRRQRSATRARVPRARS